MRGRRPPDRSGGFGAINFFLNRSFFWSRLDLEADLRQIGEAEFMRGSLRYIDYSSADERATIGDPKIGVAANRATAN
jgi:hypothetical protein